MVLSVSARSFVGLPTARDPKWIKASSDCLAVTWGMAALLRPFPSFLRPLVRPFIAPRIQFDKVMKAGQDILFPVIDERLENQERHVDVLQFLINSSKVVDHPGVTARLLGLMAASLHASSMVATHALYDMCARPEYIDELRIEAQEVLGASDRPWQFSDIKKLKRLDSLLKESMRFNQPDYLGFNRKVLDQVKLSDGTVLPKGLYINLAAESMSRDPMFYENPNQFDGRRWYHRWVASGKGIQPLEEEFAGIEPGNVAWGNGRLTCPGRWYGSAMIKLILVHMLVNYDFNFPGGQSTRPPNIYSSEAIRPDMEQHICIRKLH